VHFSEGEIEAVETVKDDALAINFRFHNLATCVDTNGANIEGKSKQNGFTGLSRGCLAKPLRIKVY